MDISVCLHPGPSTHRFLNAQMSGFEDFLSHAHDDDEGISDLPFTGGFLGLRNVSHPAVPDDTSRKSWM